MLAYPLRPSANLVAGVDNNAFSEGATADDDLRTVFVEMDAGEFAGTLMLGGLRGLVTDLVWMRAMDAKDRRAYFESVSLFQLISKLQPRFSKVWEFGSHDLAYNIGYEAESDADKFSWFVAGAEFNRQGVIRNPRDEKLLRHLAWMFFHKGETLMEEVEATTLGWFFKSGAGTF